MVKRQEKGLVQDEGQVVSAMITIGCLLGAVSVALVAMLLGG